MSGPLKKVGESVAKQALKVPRAVSAAEAPFIEPAKESTKETLMPWKGWVGRLIKEKFGDERYKAYRKLFFYLPDDIHDLHQSPNPSTKVPISDKDPALFHQFRNPSPGSQGPVNIPTIELNKDPYDNSFYKTDTTRRFLDPANYFKPVKKARLELMDPNSPDVQEMKEKLKPESSPGNKGVFATGPSSFDPTGLRATMSANHEALEKSLDENMPNHLPTPVWMKNYEEFASWYIERDLPVPLGATGFRTVPYEKRVARW